MRIIILFITIFIYSLVVFAHDYENEIVLVDHPWMKIFQENGAGYFSLKNKSETQNIKLISADSSQINKIEIHNIIMENDVMKMRPVDGGVTVKVGELIKFKPKSYHLMFFGIKGEYGKGDMIDIKLNFENSASIIVKFKVDTAKVSNHNHEH